MSQPIVARLDDAERDLLQHESRLVDVGVVDGRPRRLGRPLRLRHLLQRLHDASTTSKYTCPHEHPRPRVRRQVQRDRRRHAERRASRRSTSSTRSPSPTTKFKVLIANQKCRRPRPSSASAEPRRRSRRHVSYRDRRRGTSPSASQPHGTYTPTNIESPATCSRCRSTRSSRRTGRAPATSRVGLMPTATGCVHANDQGAGTSGQPGRG